MLDQSRRHFLIPKDVPGSKPHFSYYLWLTQIQQGRCLAVSFEKQRRARSIPTVKNMGSLYWQFNTNWQQLTFSTIDYNGNWKVSHNMVEKMFQKVLLTSYFKHNALEIWGVNDGLVPIENAQLVVRVYKYNQTDATPQVERKYPVSVAGESSKELLKISNSQLFGDACPKENCFVRMQIVSAQNTTLTQSHTYPVYLKHSSISK